MTRSTCHHSDLPQWRQPIVSCVPGIDPLPSSSFVEVLCQLGVSIWYNRSPVRSSDGDACDSFRRNISCLIAEVDVSPSKHRILIGANVHHIWKVSWSCHGRAGATDKSNSLDVGGSWVHGWGVSWLACG